MQFLRFFFHLDDLFAVVVTAVRADTVSEIEFAAVRALDHPGSCELPNVAASLITTGFGSFSLRCCHYVSSCVSVSPEASTI